MIFLEIFQIILLISLPNIVWSAFVWNTKGEAALFISIAVPIDLPTRHVFMSYNFEASYKLPPTWHKKPPIFRAGNATDDALEDFNEYYDAYEEHQHHHHKHKKQKPLQKIKKPKPLQHTKPEKHKRKQKHKSKPKPKLKPGNNDYKDFFEDFPRNADSRERTANALLSRTKFYEILRHRFEQHGFQHADRCLLRLICEANSAQLGEHNGVLGSLMHVLFSPSSSSYEALPPRYYKAELNGKEDKCAQYSAKCERSVLDLITRPLADYIGKATVF